MYICILYNMIFIYDIYVCMSLSYVSACVYVCGYGCGCGCGWEGMGLGCIFICVCVSVREAAEMVVGGVNLCWWVQRSAELSEGGGSRVSVGRGGRDCC